MIAGLFGLLIFGATPLQIDVSLLPIKSGKLRAQLPWASIDKAPTEPLLKPWSGHWWPQVDGQLWKWSDGPLKKFDQLRRWHGREGSSSKAESKRTENSKNESGLKEEWALASVFMKEPKRSVNILIDNELVEFTVGDIKALLAHTFSDSAKKLSKVYENVNPDQALQTIQQILQTKKQIFWMDKQSGSEVWPVPVYASLYEIDEISNQPNSVKIHLSLDFVDTIFSWEDKDSLELRDRSLDFFGILKGRREGKYLIIESAEWVKDPTSGASPTGPDFFWTVQDYEQASKSRKSLNPYIDIDLVDEIAERSY